jgi:CRISPR-associated protein Cmr2
MIDRRSFHFALGPVQAFVAQARRTRDFWAGSFLLSTLSAIAMREVQAQAGEVRFPRPDKTFLRALEGGRVDRPPQQGVVPNRFKAQVPAEFDPRAVCEAVRLAWVAIAGLAWKRLPEEMREGHEGLRRVWSRQIGVDLGTGRPSLPDPFWQMAWALGGEGGGEDLLDRRKLVRTAMPPDEAGAKCMLMEGWQELSGTERPSGEALDEFWMRVRPHVNQRNRTDLVEGEQLCALALVKRLFPHDFHELSEVSMPGGWAFSGWKLETGVPSVAYLAAAPWLARAVSVVDQATARQFVEAARPLDASSEHRTKLRMVEEAVPARGGLWDFAHLDGSLFFDSSLAGEKERELIAAGLEAERARRLVAEARSVLARIRQHPDPIRRHEGKLGEPLPHFAVLAMDGDDLGRNMAEPERQPPITEALARFATLVPAIVEKHSGFLVYAGGDDVRALLPVPEALPCARALRSHYEACFAGTGIASTLSGAVLFAHHKLPLGHVLQDAHELLDEVAKDGRGRDAIAVQVSSRGGDLVCWAQPWTVGLAGGPQLVLERLAIRMAVGEAPFSHRFFHRIEALLRLVNPDPERGSDPLDERTSIDLFTAELLDSSRYRDEPGVDADPADPEEGVASTRFERARAHVSALLEQCRPVVRVAPGAGDVVSLEAQGRIEAGGAFLVRFLERHQHWSPRQ